MARHSHDHGMQKLAPKAPANTAQPGTPSPAATVPAIPWGWQVALFIWTVSFAFLFLNELLQSIFKLAHR